MIVKGKIVDSNNDPIIGASVYVSDEFGNVIQPAKSAIANFDGNYSIPNVNANDYVTASYVGTTKQTKKVNATLNFNLQWIELGEVEVAGKRPFPKLLGLAVVLTTIAFAFFIIDISKQIK